MWKWAASGEGTHSDSTVQAYMGVLPAKHVVEGIDVCERLGKISDFQFTLKEGNVFKSPLT